MASTLRVVSALLALFFAQQVAATNLRQGMAFRQHASASHRMAFRQGMAFRVQMATHDRQSQKMAFRVGQTASLGQGASSGVNSLQGMKAQQGTASHQGSLSSNKALRSNQGLNAQARLHVKSPMVMVVKTLQDIVKEVQKEEKTAEKLYEEFMCDCKTTKAELEKELAATDQASLSAKIDEDTARIKQMEQELKEMEASRVGAYSAGSEANAIRTTEEKKFQQARSDDLANIDALSKAITALEKGLGGSFLQTPTASIVKKITISMDIPDSDRDVLVSFLSGGHKNEVESTLGYQPGSGEIIGILKQLKATMTKNMEEEKAQNDAAKATTDELYEAKAAEIKELDAQIIAKQQQLANLKEALATAKEELAGKIKAFQQDNKMLHDKVADCEEKETSYAKIKKQRQDEVVALTGAIAILNDDDNKRLFARTLGGSSSLIQVQEGVQAATNKALAALQSAKIESPHLNLITLALKSPYTGSFEKIIKVIDEMIAVVNEEGEEDKKKATWCRIKKGDADSAIGQAERLSTSLAKQIAEKEEELKAAEENIKEIGESATAAEKEMQEAERLRNEAKEIYESNSAAAGQTIGALETAKKHLVDFYDKPSEIQVEADFGTAFVQVEQAPYKKNQGAQGVIAELDSFISALQTQMKIQKQAEKEDADAYETLKQEDGNKLAILKQQLRAGLDQKAAIEQSLATLKRDGKGAVSTLGEQKDELKALGMTCDELLDTFDVREKARQDQIQQMILAKNALESLR